MNESCKDCMIYASLKETVDKLAKDMDIVNKDITNMKVSAGEEKQKVNNIFGILKDIKDSIDKISTQIQTINLKPAKRWENITYDVIKTIVVLAIGLMIGKKI